MPADDLVSRLRDVLDRAAERARAATRGPWTVEPEHRLVDGCRCLSCYEDEPFAWAIHEIDARGEDHSPVLTEEDATFIAEHDPAWVLRLIARDRALLDAYESLRAEVRRAFDIYESPITRPLMTIVPQRDVLHAEVERAAAFWLDGESGS
jgi:hypothetical protein